MKLQEEEKKVFEWVEWFLRRKKRDVQFGLYPTFIFSLGLERSVFCFCTSSHDSSILVVVYHRGNLGIACYMFLSWESEEKEGEKKSALVYIFFLIH